MSIITDVYHKGSNERSEKIDTNNIKDLKIDRNLGHVEINYKNGKQDLRILEKLEMTNVFIK
mgnify:CR=1 FL=1